MKILRMQLLPHVLSALGRGLSSSVGALIMAQDRHWIYTSSEYCVQRNVVATFTNPNQAKQPTTTIFPPCRRGRGVSAAQ